MLTQRFTKLKHRTAFTSTNNHIDTGSSDVFLWTKQQLDKHQIQYFSHYNPYLTDEVYEILSFDIKIKHDNDSTQTSQLPMIFYDLRGVLISPKVAIDQTLSLCRLPPYRIWAPDIK